MLIMVMKHIICIIIIFFFFANTDTRFHKCERLDAFQWWQELMMKWMTEGMHHGEDISRRLSKLPMASRPALTNALCVMGHWKNWLMMFALTLSLKWHKRGKFISFDNQILFFHTGISVSLLWCWSHSALHIYWFPWMPELIIIPFMRLKCAH